MNAVGDVLLIIGILMSFLAGLWFLITAFQENIWWGLAVLFLPLAELFFLFFHWQEAKGPFGTSVLSFFILLSGIFLSPEFAHQLL